MSKPLTTNTSSVNPFLGIGLYSIAEASTYTGIPARDITRWVYGYYSGNRDNRQHHRGLWKPKLADVIDTRTLGFHDLLEVRFVNAFRKYGVSLQAIRVASNHAQELFQHEYPFTCKQFQTDGRSIFATILEEMKDETLLDIVKKQYVFKQVIRPTLYEGIEYNSDGGADRWYPMKRSRSVVLDPCRNFGKPILTESGVSTASIAQAYLAEGKNMKRVACLYEIPLKAVETAIRFEHLDVA